jgi:hypothetical protein
VKSKTGKSEREKRPGGFGGQPLFPAFTFQIISDLSLPVCLIGDMDLAYSDQAGFLRLRFPFPRHDRQVKERAGSLFRIPDGASDEGVRIPKGIGSPIGHPGDNKIGCVAVDRIPVRVVKIPEQKLGRFRKEWKRQNFRKSSCLSLLSANFISTREKLAK